MDDQKAFYDKYKSLVYNLALNYSLIKKMQKKLLKMYLLQFLKKCLVLEMNLRLRHGYIELLLTNH